MKIHAKLQVLVVLSTMVIALMIGTLVITTRQYQRAARENEVANDLSRHLLELGLVTTDCILYQGPRAEQQWVSKHGTVTRLLATAEFVLPADRAVAERMTRNLADMRVTFGELRKRKNDPTLDPAISGELTERCVAQLSARTQAIASDSGLLARTSFARIQQIRTRRMVIFVVSILVVAGYMIGTAVAFDRGIVRPLHRLQVGTEIIGTGRLDYKVGTPVQDEIGQLSRAFDSMTDRLQKITVSRDELAAEVERRQRVEAELARSNKELELFAYVASHDLQEPLRAVAGFVDLLRQRAGGQLDESAQRYIAFAIDGAKRMQVLINGLLEYSRIATKSQPLECCEADRALADALNNLQLVIAETGAEITHDPLPAVQADPTQFSRVFYNLIGNALKFRGARPPRIHIGAVERPGEWEFSVRDNGIGIEPQYFEKIFIIFQRLHTQREYPGAGLGLAICKRIAERHGGRLWVESVPGAGSTFRFTMRKSN